jgi:hypothetical protein
MECGHEGFHSVSSDYSGHAGTLVYFWVCDRCGGRLEDIHRQLYRPRYDPHGNDRYLTVGVLTPRG